VALTAQYVPIPIMTRNTRILPYRFVTLFMRKNLSSPHFHVKVFSSRWTSRALLSVAKREQHALSFKHLCVFRVPLRLVQNHGTPPDIPAQWHTAATWLLLSWHRHGFKEIVTAKEPIATRKVANKLVSLPHPHKHTGLCPSCLSLSRKLSVIWMNSVIQLTLYGRIHDKMPIIRMRYW
jgi:hypothetical protein